MARPTTKPRVPLLDPDKEALAFTHEVLEHYRSGIRDLLAPVCALHVAAKTRPHDYLAQTSLYALVRALAAYAVHGEKPDKPVQELIAALEPLATSPLWTRVDVETIAANVDPNGEPRAIELIIAAAIARQQIEDGKYVVTTSQLAILAGMTRRNMGAVIRAGELVVESEGRRGTGGASLVKPAEARRWLAERKVPGFARTRAKN